MIARFLSLVLSIILLTSRIARVHASCGRDVHMQVTPVIIFQGLDDKVVPVNQAELMTAALTRKGVPHAYLSLYARAWQNIKL
jgi:hypothetical protein